MRENVLVIGNGFDLAHGMRTKYEHFIEYVRAEEYKTDNMLNEEEKNETRKIVETNGFIKYFLDLTSEVPGWVDFERELLKVTEQFSQFCENYNVMIYEASFDVRLHPQHITALLGNILSYFGIVKKYDRSYIVEPFVFSTIYGLNKRAILRLLKENLDNLARGLEIYLLRCKRKFANDLSSKAIEQIQTINPSYVISFNYTDTYEIYGINSEDVFHIHGRLEQGNMVLGYDDKNPEELDFVYFKKYFQRIQKLTGYLDREKLYTNNYGIIEYANVHFYGHSMDKTDGDIIELLASIANSFVIYIYNQEDYEQKVINLIDIFGKKRATEMIQNGFVMFEQCKS